MDTVLVEFTTVNKKGIEQFMLLLQDVCLLGKSKEGCCVMSNNGEVYDVVNVYEDVKKTLAGVGIKVIDLPVPNV